MTHTFIPHDYQIPAMEHLTLHRRCALWAGMGTGKTVVTYTALDRLDAVEDVYPVLVVATKRVADITWATEAKKWAHLAHLRVVVVSGTERQRIKALKQPADYYVTNYEQLAWLVRYFGDKWPFSVVVADELTRLKSYRLRQGGSRAGALGKVVHGTGSRFIGLTGTPNPNGLKDLWGQMWFIDRGERLGRTYSAFEMRWFRIGYDGFSIQPMEHAQKQIEELLADVCLTVTGLPVDLPIIQPVYVDLTPSVRQLYMAMEKEAFAVIADEGVEAVNAAVRLNKCLQICNGALYLDDGKRWERVHDAKIDALRSILAEAGGAPVLIGYNFRSDLERLLAAFPGALNLNTKDGLAAALRGEGTVWIGHPKSIGHGVDGLQEHCHHVAFFGLNWNLEEYLQFIERVGPQRQKQSKKDRPTFVYPILVRNTVDDLVWLRLASKRSVQDVLLEAMKRKK